MNFVKRLCLRTGQHWRGHLRALELKSQIMWQSCPCHHPMQPLHCGNCESKCFVLLALALGILQLVLTIQHCVQAAAPSHIGLQSWPKQHSKYTPIWTGWQSISRDHLHRARCSLTSVPFRAAMLSQCQVHPNATRCST